MKFQGRYYTLNIYGKPKEDEQIASSLYPHLYEVKATPKLEYFFSFPGNNQQQLIKFHKERPLKSEIFLEYNGMEHNKIGISISEKCIEMQHGMEQYHILQLPEFYLKEIHCFYQMSQKEILTYLINKSEVLSGNKKEVKKVLLGLADKIDKQKLIAMLSKTIM